jgi:chromosome segregation ATPase
MARVNYDTIKIACETLLKDGQRVSASNVLGITGGSKGTVVKYLRQWRESVEKQQNTLVEELGLSPDYISALNAEISRYTTKIENKYTTLLEQAKDAEIYAISALEEAEIKIEENKVTSNELNTALNRAQDTIEALQKTLTQKESIISELTDKRDQALMNAAKLEIKLESALKYQGKADTLQSTLEKERNARHQAELTNAKLQALLDRDQT